MPSGNLSSDWRAGFRAPLLLGNPCGTFQFFGPESQVEFIPVVLGNRGGALPQFGFETSLQVLLILLVAGTEAAELFPRQLGESGEIPHTEAVHRWCVPRCTLFEHESPRQQVRYTNHLGESTSFCHLFLRIMPCFWRKTESALRRLGRLRILLAMQPGA